MPVKFVSSIILIAIVGIFCGFNWGEESRASINLIFYKTPEIPVFLIIIISFLAGFIVMAVFSAMKSSQPRLEAKSSESKKVELKAEVQERQEKIDENPAETQKEEKDDGVSPSDFGTAL